MRVAGEGTIGRRHGGRAGIEAEQIAIGLVGIKHAARAVGDQRPLRQIIDERLGDVVARLAGTEMEDADGAREQAEHADHGKAGKDREHERLRHLARQHGKGDCGHGKCKRKQHDQTHTAVAFATVGGGRGVAHRRVDIGHEAQNSRFEYG